MAVAVESMFSVREVPWHGLGTIVSEAPESAEALRVSGLDWGVYQQAVYAENGQYIKGFKANVRDTDDKVLGLVTTRYKVIQNSEAFSFTDELLGSGVKYETAGSLQCGRKVWLLAKLPTQYKICGDDVETYLVFCNSHDGSGAVKIAITPIRVVCNNTLNLALQRAERSYSIVHVGDVNDKIDKAGEALFMAQSYMDSLSEEAEELASFRLTEKQVDDYIKLLLPVKKDNMQHIRNIHQLRSDLMYRYQKAPDLQGLGDTAYRFVNAVSDFATHAAPLRKTVSYGETKFAKTVDGIR